MIMHIMYIDVMTIIIVSLDTYVRVMLCTPVRVETGSGQSTYLDQMDHFSRGHAGRHVKLEESRLTLWICNTLI